MNLSTRLFKSFLIEQLGRVSTQRFDGAALRAGEGAGRKKHICRTG